MTVNLRFVALVAAAAMVACSPGSTGSTTSPTGSAPSSPPSMASSPSATSSSSAGGDFVVGGDRPVTVHLPGSAPRGPAALLMMLHGYGSTGSMHESYFRFGPVADEHGIVYLYPDGTLDSQGNRFWNATDACCDFDATGIDDVAYLEGVLSDVGRAVSIDPKRVYVVGHSNGGFMSYRMACEHADVIAAITSLAGATVADPADCKPTEALAVLEIHGSADDVIEFRGGRLSDIGAPGDKPSYPGANATVASWAAYDGCDPAATRSPSGIDLDSGIDGSSGPAESTVDTWSGCDPGGHVELWTVQGGGHSPELAPTFATSVIDFLLAHPKP